jgi:dTDP-4-amino-4,6-dideoxygalactose transaminase
MAISASQPAALRFPFLDLKAQYAAIQPEVERALQRVFASQHFIGGEEVRAFEQEIACYIGAKHAIACASGTDALLLPLMALGIGPGDEVICPPFTFVATAGSIARLGARPVFADIDPATFNLDPAMVESRITPRTKAILPVHLFGLMADMSPVVEIGARHGIPLLEDAAQAIGARYHAASAGTTGLINCFSFYPTKNLGAAGDGGLMTTSDDALADRLRLLCNHGGRTKYSYQILGTNSRLDALQAALLRVKLRYLESWTEGRRRNAQRYGELFRAAGLERKIKLPTEPAGYRHIYNQFTIRLSSARGDAAASARLRDDLRRHLRDAGIPTDIYYPAPLHLEQAFAYLGHRAGDFPASEAAAREVLALPIYPELNEDHQRAVVEEIARFYRP